MCVFWMCNNFFFLEFACTKQINSSPFWCVLSRLLWTRQQLRTKLYNRLTISIWALKIHEGEIFYFSVVVGFFRRIHCFSHFFPVFEQEEFSRKCILKKKVLTPPKREVADDHHHYYTQKHRVWSPCRVLCIFWMNLDLRL